MLSDQAMIQVKPNQVSRATVSPCNQLFPIAAGTTGALILLVTFRLTSERGSDAERQHKEGQEVLLAQPDTPGEVQRADDGGGAAGAGHSGGLHALGHLLRPPPARRYRRQHRRLRRTLRRYHLAQGKDIDTGMLNKFCPRLRESYSGTLRWPDAPDPRLTQPALIRS